MPRPRTPILSVDRIADAAIELVDEGAGFGVNALARRLGVTASSLYNHISGRDEIIELMRARLATQSIPDIPEDAGWHEVVSLVVRGQREMYAAHPFVVPLIVGKTITDPGVITAYERMASALIAGGFPDDDVLTIISVIDSFSLGAGLDLAAPDDVWEPTESAATLSRLLKASGHGRERSDRAFETGLQLLLDSLRMRLATG
ncbi:TetR/AcrR family transcriptional regulator C-terminal domain-containing protein [Pseudarthrobacter oxydans]|uniref:TetR/AcrR family transcriptional regulator n=1 Tax=Pseudarthrobacter oxydans TaxID=1671 RepID=UPI003D27D18F